MLNQVTVFLVGPSGSGKTTTIEKIINLMKDLSIATVKYMHHPEFTIDPAGKDSRKHRDAGAIFTVCAAPKETAILINKEHRDDLDEIANIIQNLPKNDLIIFESYNQPPSGSNTILCGNNDQELTEFYKYVAKTNILAVSSYGMKVSWNNIDIFNSLVNDELTELCDRVLNSINNEIK